MGMRMCGWVGGGKCSDSMSAIARAMHRPPDAAQRGNARNERTQSLCALGWATTKGHSHCVHWATAKGQNQ
jgi:hypothetical protein